jgi:glycine cleavage system T protein
MGQFLVAGVGAGQALSALVTAPILDCAPGEAKYALLTKDDAGVIDDLFIYRLAESSKLPDPWFVVVNAGNREKDFAWLKERLPEKIQLNDLSDEIYMMAVQGPNAVELLDRLSSPLCPSSCLCAFVRNIETNAAPQVAKFSEIERAHCGALSLAGIPAIAGRTGYTGEDGAEIFCEVEKAAALWEALLAEAKAAGIEAGPVGLAARDSLRFEAGMPLYGHELNEDTTPPESLFYWNCDLRKEFPGKELIIKEKAEGLKKKLVTLNVTGGVPREGYKVFGPPLEKNSHGDISCEQLKTQREEYKDVGVVVAGMFCPTVGTYSANAFVPLPYSAAGTKLAVEIRGNLKDAVVVKRPLYSPVYRKIQ